MRSRRGDRRERTRGERGQSSVEFVALLPVLTAAALCLGQSAVAGYAAWTASGAARVGARAQALGEDPQRAVRQALPAMLARGHRVSASTGDGVVTVRLPVPSVVPGLSFGRVRARAGMPEQVAP